MPEPLPPIAFSPYPPARLDVRALTLARGDLTLAQGLSFSLDAGEAILLRGPNGSGKTTLLRVLAGFTPAPGGEAELTLAGHDSEPEQVVAYVGHADGLRRTETPRQHLAFIAQWLGCDVSRLPEAFRHFHLGPIADAPSRRLSAGQKRRTALARLIVAPRPVWLLDEPAAPLDAGGRMALATMVTAHRAAGGAVIAAVHDEPGWADTRTIQLGDLAPGARAA
jgi:heme exporter protein A